jgi:hypothetical protein
MVIAAAGYIPAVAGALLQELVDLATILNALRALRPAAPASARNSGVLAKARRQRQPL